MPDQPRLFPWGTPNGLDPTSNRKAILEEVQNGLRNEKERLYDAQENQSFVDLDGQRYTPRREAETEFDYAGRPKRVTGFMRQCVSRLCQHTYNPGPSRTATDAGAADELLQQVYEQNHIDMLMQEAEQLSTINDVAAIEVKATNDSERPIDLQVWGAEEFTVFLDPADQRKPLAVVTIDRFDASTRFRVWFDDMVTTFRTTKLEHGQTAGGIIAIQDGPPEPNTYGCIPFAFVHYAAPVRRFWTPGPGSFIRMAETRINDRLSKLDESLDKFFNPIGLFINVGTEFNPETGPGRFLRLNRKTSYSGDGFADEGDPDAKYLQAELAVEQAWADVREFMGQIAEASDLPPSALRLDYNDAPSGISIVIRAFPLLTRARQRRPIYQRAETDLARVICTVAGNHYGKAEIASAAPTLRMLLSWPEPRIPVPGQERDDSDGWELGQRIKSRVQVVMERYGLTREQALEHLKQVEDDEKEATALLPPPEERQPINTPANLQQDGNKTDLEDPEEEDAADEETET